METKVYAKFIGNARLGYLYGYWYTLHVAYLSVKAENDTATRKDVPFLPELSYSGLSAFVNEWTDINQV